ncbi:MAG: tRNA1(Val) (adenine(37)-N6)-methyltransferase [Anaerovoracaceae bacterium]|nr:tRNA1(Val) (adenine(37)-N6)-methyltransferase [Anaerovoracaceae bacterium]
MTEIKQNERVDLTGFGSIGIIQDPGEFCYGVDSVLLADFCAGLIKKTGTFTRIMDLGTGSGIIPLILCHKTPAGTIYGIDIQENSIDRALRSSHLNDLEDRLNFMVADVKDFVEENGDLKGTFDAVTCNPPYFVDGGGIKPDNPARLISRHETTAGLEDFIRCASELLRDKGDLFMVHRPSRLCDIFQAARKYSLEPKSLRQVVPRRGETANIVLVHMIKNGGSDLSVLPELAVHDNKGNYTEELREAYL